MKFFNTDKLKFLTGKPKKDMIGVHLTQDEAEEIFSLLQAILRDNTPEGDDLNGEDLVAHCLLHNDPETFRERNKAFADAMEQFSQLHGMSVEPEQETFKDAEDEYTYLALISNIYYKLFNVCNSAKR